MREYPRTYRWNETYHHREQLDELLKNYCGDWHDYDIPHGLKKMLQEAVGRGWAVHDECHLHYSPPKKEHLTRIRLLFTT